MSNQKKHRMTRQRRIILEELRKVDNHPSADEIYEIVRKRIPRISLGTVYRNLEILSELNQIKKLAISGNLKRFDGNIANHYHIRCLGCGRVDDVKIAPLKDIEQQLSGTTGFTITGHNLEFNGYCPDCS